MVETDSGDSHNPSGLGTRQAQARLQRFGSNEIADLHPGLLRRGLEKLWAPVPWMLETAIVLQLAFGRYLEAALVGLLVGFNAVVAMIQERRAQGALAMLKAKLTLTVNVCRDGAWTTLPSRDIVPGDLLQLSLGGVVPADARIVSGTLLLDQSMLTGESLAIEAGPGTSAFAGALVRRGEAQALVTATGANTHFGRAAELVKTAHVAGTQQRAVLHVVRNLAIFNGAVIVALGLAAWKSGMPLSDIEPLVLTCLLASIPIALPATFTLAAALSARALAGKGVLATRLSALDEAGAMDVLCADKTGTLTRNELRVAQVLTARDCSETRLLELAVLASSQAGMDPVDAAIRSAAGTLPGSTQRLAFKAFDPGSKYAEAWIADTPGERIRVLKGAFAVVAALCKDDPSLRQAAEVLESQGNRVLAVASGTGAQMTLAGLIALSDPPREDAAALIARLAAHRVRVLMVTGDARTTAEAVARKLGLEGAVCTATSNLTNIASGACGVFASVLPEDKFTLVKALQAQGHVVGMCGDGANDAAALRQAHMGIAVAQATDIAKASAGLVLTEAGLGGVMAAVEEGRRTFQRVHSYALNSLVKKVATVLFIAIGFVMTKQAILSPLLMIVYLIAGDFLSMALATDRVDAARTPNSWRIDELSLIAVVLGLVQLGFATLVLAIGAFWLQLDSSALPTLAFLTLVFGGQATIYAIRSPRGVLALAPGGWLVAASIVDLLVGVAVATSGIISASLSFALITVLFGASIVLTFLLHGLYRLSRASLVRRRLD